MTDIIKYVLWIFVASGLYIPLYMLLRKYLIINYPDNGLINVLITLADQAVQETEKRFSDASSQEKFDNALHKLFLLADDHGVQLPSEDSTKIYIEAAVKRLDGIVIPPKPTETIVTGIQEIG